MGNIRWQVGRAIGAISHIGESRHEYKESIRGQGLSPHEQAGIVPLVGLETIDKYKDISTAAFTWLKDEFRTFNIENVTSEQIQKWIEAKISEGLTEKTLNEYATALFRCGQGLDIVKGEANRAESWFAAVRSTIENHRGELIGGPGREAYPRPSELVAAISNADAQLVARVALETGVRLREVENLRDGGIGGRGRNILNENNTLTVTGKGGKVRTTIAMNPATAQAVRDKIAESGGKWEFSRRTVEAHIEKAALATTQYAKGRGAHGLRHNYAMERLNMLVSAGHKERVAKLEISKELGHNRVMAVYFK